MYHSNLKTIAATQTKLSEFEIEGIVHNGLLSLFGNVDDPRRSQAEKILKEDFSWYYNYAKTLKDGSLAAVSQNNGHHHIILSGSFLNFLQHSELPKEESLILSGIYLLHTLSSIDHPLIKRTLTEYLQRTEPQAKLDKVQALQKIYIESHVKKVESYKNKGIPAEKAYELLHAQQKPRPFFPGQTLTFNRTGDGYTDPKYFPDHTVLPAHLSTGDHQFKTFRSFQTPQGCCLFIINDKTREGLFAIDFLEYLRFGNHEYRPLGEQLAEAFILKTFATSTHLPTRNKAEEQLKEISSSITKTLLKLEQHYSDESLKDYQRKKDLKIEGISINVKTGAFSENATKIKEALKGAHNRKVNLAVLPELIFTSYQVADSVTHPRFLRQQLEKAFKPVNAFQRYLFAQDSSNALGEILNSQTDTETRDLILKEYRELLEKIDTQETRGFKWLHACENKSADMQPKEEKVMDGLKQILETHLRGKSKKITEAFQERYEDFGIALLSGAAIPNGGDKPYNGAYATRADGSLAIQIQKQRLADDPSSIFYEKHIFLAGNPNYKYVWEFRGWRIGPWICEDEWQEPDQKIGAKLVHSQGGIILDYKLKNRVNTGAEIKINSSASPEQIGKLTPHPLKVTNWDNLPPGFTILEDTGFTMESPRSDRRKGLISTTSAHLQVPELYVNSLGGYDHIIMGGASFLYSGKGELLGTSKQFQESFLTFTLSKNHEFQVAPNNQGDVLLSPEDQAIEAIILNTLDYMEKNELTLACLYNNGSIQARFLQKVLEEVKKKNHIKLTKRLIRDTILLDFPGKTTEELLQPSTQKKIKKKVEENFAQRSIKIKTFLMPTWNHRLIEALRAGWQAIRGRSSEIEFHFMFGPDWLIPVSAEAALKSVIPYVPVVLTGLFWIIGISNIAMIFLSVYLLWPIVNLTLKFLGLQRWNRPENLSFEIENYIRREERPQSELRAPIPSEFLKDVTQIVERQAKIKSHRSFTQLWTHAVSKMIEGLFVDNISILRNYTIWHELKRRKHAINIGILTDTEKNPGTLTGGGVEASGFLPLQSIDRTTVRKLYLHWLKKESARARNRSNPISAELERMTRLSANWVENHSLVRKWLRNLINPLSWNINTAAQQHYRVRILKDILTFTTDPKRQAYLEKIIAREEKKLPPISKVRVQEPSAPLKLGSLEFRFRPTRLNKVAPDYSLAVIDWYLTKKDLKQMILFKHYIDPNQLMSWEEFSYFVAHRIHRYESTNHKNQNTVGPVLKAGTPGAHMETKSQEASEIKSIATDIQQILKEEYKNIELPDLDSLIKKKKNPAIFWVNGGQDGDVERNYEKHQITAELQHFVETADSGNCFILIESFSQKTHQIALETAKVLKNQHKKSIDIILVTDIQDIKDLKSPDKISDFDYLYVAPERWVKEKALKDLQSQYTVTVAKKLD